MKLQDLNEGLSPVLYHSTGIHNLFEIIKTNKFRLTLDLGTDAEIDLRKGDKFFYMSTSRNRSGKFTQNQAVADSNAMIVLDGRKLQANYSGRAVNYWSGSDLQTIKNHELEDRIYSRKQYIPNATKYIKEVHILLKPNDRFEQHKSFARRAYRMLKQNEIPVYLYDNQRDYINNRRDKAIPATSLGGGEDHTTFSNIRGEDKYNSGKYDQKTIHNSMGIVKELYYKSRLYQLSRRAKKESHQLSSYTRDIILSMKADIHNYRRKRDMGALTEIFRKEGFKKTEDFIMFLENKWGKIRDNLRDMGIRSGRMPKTEEDQMDFVVYNSLNVKDLFEIGIIPSQKVQIALVSSDYYAIKYLEDEGIDISPKVRAAAEKAKSEKRF